MALRGSGSRVVASQAGVTGALSNFGFPLRPATAAGATTAAGASAAAFFHHFAHFSQLGFLFRRQHFVGRCFGARVDEVQFKLNRKA